MSYFIFKTCFLKSTAYFKLMMFLCLHWPHVKCSKAMHLAAIILVNLELAYSVLRMQCPEEGSSYLCLVDRVGE